MVFLLLPALPSILPALLAAVGLLSLTVVFPALNTTNRNISDGVHNLPSISNKNYTEGLPDNRYDSRNVSTQIPQIIEAITPKAVSGSVENPCEKDNGGCKHFCYIVNGEAKCSCAAGYKPVYDRKHCELYQQGLPASRLDSRNVSTQVPKIIEDITPKTVSGSFENPCIKKDRGGCHHLCFIIYGKAKCICGVGYILGPDGKHCIENTEGLPETIYDSNVSTQIPKIIEAITPKAVSGSVENPCEQNNGGCDQFCGIIDGEVICICVRQYMLGLDGKRCIYIRRSCSRRRHSKRKFLTSALHEEE